MYMYIDPVFRSMLFPVGLSPICTRYNISRKALKPSDPGIGTVTLIVSVFVLSVSVCFYTHYFTIHDLIHRGSILLGQMKRQILKGKHVRLVNSLYVGPIDRKG